MAPIICACKKCRERNNRLEGYIDYVENLFDKGSSMVELIFQQDNSSDIPQTERRLNQMGYLIYKQVKPELSVELNPQIYFKVTKSPVIVK